MIIKEKKRLKLFHFDNYALAMTLLPRNLVRQIFVFHNMLYTQIKNKFVIIHRVSWNRINEFSIILITSSSMIDNCDLIEKGISRN